MKERLKRINEFTPAIQQYIRIKSEYPDCILFFRLGDFYEQLFEDAETVSRELEIALTSKGCGGGKKAPMSGIPYHSHEPYLYKLVEKGYKVAIVEQLQDPKEVKGLVERGVVRIISKGTVNEGSNLNAKDNNFLSAIAQNNDKYDISLVDISTGEIFVAWDLTLEESINEILSQKPSEIILNKELSNNKNIQVLHKTLNSLNSIYNRSEDNPFIIDKFNSYSKVRSLHIIFNYIEDTQRKTLQHFTDIQELRNNDYMELDHFTIKNLELIESLHDNKKKGSLLGVIDHTVTSAGGRLLKQWIQKPLISINKINDRLNTVELFIQNIFVLHDIRENLKSVYDLERIISKLSFGTINAKDVVALKNSLSVVPTIKNSLNVLDYPYIKVISKQLSNLDDLVKLLEVSIIDSPPTSLREGGIFKDGFNKELDELRDLQVNGKQWLIDFAQREKEKVGASTLKVSYSKNFGYYIEVSKKQSNLVPDYYNRLQTLVNAERYTTEELVNKTDSILNAEDKVKELEYTLFLEIRSEIEKHILDIKNISNALSTIDVLTTFAKVSLDYNYSKPTITADKQKLVIKGNRHPVAEQTMEQFISNDIELDKDNNIMLITGPNASGKSTYMKSIATSVLMAQIGCFIPASNATFSIVDRIFTRIGASDDILNGESTFMLELKEINQALQFGTEDSLIIIDELGRGTSTQEGIAIADSVIHYIHDKIKSRSLIATHYHELTELENKLEKVTNYSMKVFEEEDSVVFLHKMDKGTSGKSYGIYCAKLCNLPEEVISMANHYLENRPNDVINNDTIVNYVNDKVVNNNLTLEKTKNVVNNLIKENNENKIKEDIKLETKDIGLEDIANKQEEMMGLIKELLNNQKDSHTSNNQQLDIFSNNEQQVIQKLKEINILEINPLQAFQLVIELKKLI